MVISSIAGAVIIAPVSVMAISLGGLQSTIASIIISLMLQAGVAPVNQSYLTALNTSYGYTIETAISEGLLTESAGTLVDTGLSSAIESASAYTDLGLSEIFTTTAADAGVVAGSGAVNIANTAIHVGTAGTIGAFAGAVAVGVGAGVLLNNFLNWAGDSIRAGISYFNTPRYLAELGDGASFASVNRILSSGKAIETKWLVPDGVRLFGYKNTNNSIRVYMVSKNKPFSYYYDDNYNYYEKVSNVDVNRVTYNFNNSGKTNNIILFENSEEAYEESSNYINNEYTAPSLISPDIIGTNGNAIYDNGYNVNGNLENGEDMTPVNMNDYQTFADNANNNTDAGNTGQDNADLFNDLIDSLIVDAPTIPDEPIIPDSPVDVPTVPDRPVVPEQPTIPGKPDVTQEDIDEALEGVTTIDLRSVFPFCIPFDLYNIIKIFDTGENRRAPHIVYTFPGTDWTLDIDLVVYDTAAGILRLMELILFIIGLAVATRKLIGAGG